MKKIIALILCLFVLGCMPPAPEKKEVQKITTFEDCESYGYPVMESYPRKCSANGETFVESVKREQITPPAEPTAPTIDDAVTLAKSSACGDRLITTCTCPEGYTQEGDACNPNCYSETPKCLAPSKMCEKKYSYLMNRGVYWFDLNASRPTCENPVCVVDTNTKNVIIDWKCTGSVPFSEEALKETCNGMTLDEALRLSKPCTDQGILMETHMCNSGTNTWWIDLKTFDEKKGCNPACVINLQTKSVEINWRCTGLLPT